MYERMCSVYVVTALPGPEKGSDRLAAHVVPRAASILRNMVQGLPPIQTKSSRRLIAGRQCCIPIGQQISNLKYTKTMGLKREHHLVTKWGRVWCTIYSVGTDCLCLGPESFEDLKEFLHSRGRCTEPPLGMVLVGIFEKILGVSDN